MRLAAWSINQEPKWEVRRQGIWFVATDPENTLRKEIDARMQDIHPRAGVQYVSQQATSVVVYFKKSTPKRAAQKLIHQIRPPQAVQHAYAV